MIRSFRHRGLKRLHGRGDGRRLRPDLVGRMSLILADLEMARNPSDLNLPRYRTHPLKGDLEGYWSVAVSGNWRIVFRFWNGDAYDVDLVDYH
ncbi:MAG: type II toxin-antitoxin system RelE/ParE family toxin [Gemmatimonadota bacterium]|nr:type II toxin-antitoxin system RelE/ParE family toxin [Gemmatimonadota bacterium]